MTSLCPCLGENSPEALERMKQNKINEDIKRGKKQEPISIEVKYKTNLKLQRTKGRNRINELKQKIFITVDDKKIPYGIQPFTEIK